jgi:hypothetical protein
MSKLTETLLYQRLLDVLNYNPETGVFIWKIQLSGKGKIGSVAGCVTPSGYRQIRIDCTTFLAHRLAWFYVYGAWPKRLDHEDGNRDNNCIKNLRLATVSENAANKKLQITNTSGFKSVRCRPNKAGEMRWRAIIEIQENGKRKHITIGTFATGEEASTAYLKAAEEHFGEFARAV